MSSLAVAVFPDFENTYCKVYTFRADRVVMRFNQRLFIQIDWDASLPEQFVTNHAIRSLEICSEITEPGKVLILKFLDSRKLT